MISKRHKLFMSPELLAFYEQWIENDQVENETEDRKKIDLYRADIFSLGTVLLNLVIFTYYQNFPHLLIMHS